MYSFNPKVNKDKDVILFPFTEMELNSDDFMNAEYGKYANSLELEVFDLDDLNKEAPKFEGNLIIIGHSTNDMQHKHKLSSGSKIRYAEDVAKMIAKAKFPKGAKNQIIVWSCYGGVDCGFSHLLATHLTSYGYTGKQIWGSKYPTGVINEDLFLRVKVNGPTPRRASASDVTQWIGSA